MQTLIIFAVRIAQVHSNEVGTIIYNDVSSLKWKSILGNPLGNVSLLKGFLSIYVSSGFVLQIVVLN